MPLIDENDFRRERVSPSVSEINKLTEIGEQKPSPTFTETLSAAFSESNIMSNVYQAATRDWLTGEITEGFDPLTEENLAGYEAYANRFIDVKNQTDNEIIKHRIDRERDIKETLDNSSGFYYIVSELAAGLLDPTILFPAAKIATTSARAARVAQGLATGAAFSATAGITREAILQSTQETRTIEESATTVIAETALGSVLGGAIGLISSGSKAASTVAMDEILQQKEIPLKVTEDSIELQEKGSVGAASIRESRLRKEGIAHLNNTFTKGITSGGMKWLQSPIVRGLTNEYGAVREFTNNLFFHNLIIEKNVQGVARGEIAELAIREKMGKLTQDLDKVDKLFIEAYDVKGTSRFRLSKDTRLKYADFQERVSKILRDDTIKDELPQVNSAAKIFREQIDTMGNELKEAGILDKDVVSPTSKNYFTRIYDTVKLLDVDVKNSFVNDVANYFTQWTRQGFRRAIPLAEDEAELRALEVYDNIMGQGDRAMEFNGFSEVVRSSGKFTKERALLIPDEILQPYLINDASLVTSNFIRKASALVETQKAINRMGYKSLGDLKQALRTENEERLANVKDLKKRKKIQKEFKEALFLADKMYDVMTGTLRKAKRGDRFFDTILTYQFTRLLGGAMISQVPEIAGSMFRLGVGQPLYKSLIPLVRDMQAFKQSVEQLKDLDIGTELINNSSLRALGGINEFGSETDEWVRSMHVISDKFGKLSGLTYITQLHRVLAGHLSLSAASRDLKRVSKWSKKKRELYASGGIGKAEIPGIIEQIDKYAEERSGSFIANMHLWDNLEAKRQFSRFIQTQVDSIVLRPGRGDIPFFAQSSKVGQVIFQFKSFMATATNRLLLSGIQRRDATAILGFMAITYMGVINDVAKSLLAGKDPEQDLSTLLMNGISRGAIPGLFATAIMDIGAMGAHDRTRRYVGKFGQGELFGPSVSQTQDLFDIYGRLTTGKITEGDKRAFLRMAPIYNLWFIQLGINQLNT